MVEMTRPAIPPLTHLRDIAGRPITIDCEVVVRNPLMGGRAMCRATVVGIGDPGLPDQAILKVRPHGSTYISTAGNLDVEVRSFDPLLWLKAEETAAHLANARGVSLDTCLFGGFHFDTFQREALMAYLTSPEVSLAQLLIGTRYEIAEDGDTVKWRYQMGAWSVGSKTREDAWREIRRDMEKRSTLLYERGRAAGANDTPPTPPEGLPKPERETWLMGWRKGWDRFKARDSRHRFGAP